MKLFHFVLIASMLSFIVLSGCTGGNPDDEFRQAWQASETDVIQYGNEMRTAMGPEGTSDIDMKAISEKSQTMIGTIDRHYATISSIQVSSKYTTAQQTYLAGLSDLRMACVDLSKVQDAGSAGALGYITTASPWLQNSQENREQVKGIMNQ